MKKIAAVIMICALLSAILTLLCAADEVGEIKNITISQEGVITWDPYEGAEKYWIGIDDGYVPSDGSHDLASWELSAGLYKITVNAYVYDPERLVASSTVYVEYDGEKYKISNEALETTPDGEIDYGDGVIKNVQLTADGVLSWDEYKKAGEYWLGVDGAFTPVNNGDSLTGRIKEPGEYRIEINAYTKPTDLFIAAWNGTAVYDGTSFVLQNDAETAEQTDTETNDATGAAETETGTETDDLTETLPEDTRTDAAPQTQEQTGSAAADETAPDGETSGSAKEEKNGVSPLIPVLCAVIAVMAAAIVFLAVKMKKKKETK